MKNFFLMIFLFSTFQIRVKLAVFCLYFAPWIWTLSTGYLCLFLHQKLLISLSILPTFYIIYPICALCRLEQMENCQELIDGIDFNPKRVNTRLYAKTRENKMFILFWGKLSHLMVPVVEWLSDFITLQQGEKVTLSPCY